MKPWFLLGIALLSPLACLQAETLGIESEVTIPWGQRQKIALFSFRNESAEPISLTHIQQATSLDVTRVKEDIRNDQQVYQPREIFDIPEYISWVDGMDDFWVTRVFTFQTLSGIPFEVTQSKHIVQQQPYTCDKPGFVWYNIEEDQSPRFWQLTLNDSSLTFDSCVSQNQLLKVESSQVGRTITLVITPVDQDFTQQMIDAVKVHVRDSQGKIFTIPIYCFSQQRQGPH